MKQIKFENHVIANYHAPYIIAEIGANHNGDMELAREMIDSAKANGAHCVKFQSWTESSLVSKSEYNRNQVYTDSKKKHFGSLRQMIKKYALTESQHVELSDYCKEVEIHFASSPFSLPEAKLLDRLNVPFIKIASMDINYHPFISEVAKIGRPIVLSTGMSTLSEIDQALNICHKAGNPSVVLLHCISIYPPEYKDIHLNNILMLQQTFGVPVGFSDHTIGTAIPLASAALGASIIEKHFTLDKDLPGWDHEISADPEELKIITEGVKHISTSLGSHQRTVSAAEEAKKAKFRRSIVVTKNLPAGHILVEADITAKRPGTHISPDNFQRVIGRKLKIALEADDLIQWDMFE